MHECGRGQKRNGRRAGQEDECTTAESRRHLRARPGRMIVDQQCEAESTQRKTDETTRKEHSGLQTQPSEKQRLEMILCEDLIEESIV